MSTTPRTDAAVIASGFQAVPYGFQEFARQLETELAAEREKSERYRLASLKLDVELVAMKARAEKAEADTARLDWLLARNVSLTIWHQGPHSGGVWVTSCPDRAAIDASMKEDSK